MTESNDSWNSFSDWAKFCIEVQGRRVFDNNKPVSKHRLFSLCKSRVDFSNKGSVSGILPFLKEKFEVKDAYGWKSGAKEPWFLRSY